MSSAFLVLSAFLASSVEMVEAMTIVLAAGLTRGWRSPLLGVAAALVALGAVIGSLGPALTLIPIDILRVIVGGLLLVFGLQWLRKAILRASGYKALHDEEAIFRQEAEEARVAGYSRGAFDPYGFTLAFKGVFLEGLEVAFIVVTFGSAQGSILLASIGAGIALVIVGGAGAVIHRPLSRVPENTLKFAVGLMLTTFGIFWGAEGVGVEWPGTDLALIGILIFLIIASFVQVRALKAMHAKSVWTTEPAAVGVVQP